MIETTQRVLLVFEGENIGYYDGIDTLYLVKLNFLDHVYKDILHQDQKYYTVHVVEKSGFFLSILPLAPYRRKVHGILLQSNASR